MKQQQQGNHQLRMEQLCNAPLYQPPIIYIYIYIYI